MDQLAKMRYLKLRVALSPGRRLGLPNYPGSAFRGALGHALRRVACSQRHQDCADCLLQKSCVYPYLFATPAPDHFSRGNRVPPPYIIEPWPHIPRVIEPGEEFGFDLILLGRAVEYLPYVLVALDLWHEQGIGPARVPVDLLYVDRLDYAGNGEQRIFDGQLRRMFEPEAVLTGKGLLEHTPWVSDAPVQRVRLRFEVMTRLTHQGKLVDEPRFVFLVRALLRRLGTLLEVHWGTKPDWDFSGLVSQAAGVRLLEDRTHWFDWERYSRRQRSRMALGGIRGEAVYEGQLQPFRELLVLGSVFHVGKNATFGLGKYSILG